MLQQNDTNRDRGAGDHYGRLVDIIKIYTVLNVC